MAKREGKVVTFYSYKGGCGRTMALANTAWILASNGYRVLAVDWDLEAPGLHRFFKPFLDAERLAETPGIINLITDFAFALDGRQDRYSVPVESHARLQPHAVRVDWDFPDDGVLDFVSAGKQNRDYSSAFSQLDWAVFLDNYRGADFLDSMRETAKQDYDYVLLDSRTGLSDVADICTLQLPDILVLCVALNNQSIDGVLNVARYVSETTGRSMLAADIRLTKLITSGVGGTGSRGPVTDMPRMAEDVRQQHKRQFIRWHPGEPSTVLLSYVPADRMWADWIKSVLEGAGFPVLTGQFAADTGKLIAKADRTIAVVSAAYQRSAHAKAVVEYAAGVNPGKADITLVRVGELAPGPLADQAGIALIRFDETHARHILLRALEPLPLDFNPAQLATSAVRYPDAEPQIWRAPTRNANFTGRVELLERLFDRLSQSSTTAIVPQVLQGMGGTGKT